MTQKRPSARIFERKFRTEWLDELPVPIYVLDAKAQVVFYNAAAKALMGYSAGEAMGKPAEKFIAPHGIEAYLQEILSLYRGIPSRDVSYDVVTRDGHLLHVVADMSPVFNEKRTKVEFVIGYAKSWKRGGKAR